MVAQRHLRVSYVTILLLLHLTSFTSGIFLVYAVRSWVRDQNVRQVIKFLLGFFSPLLASLILVVPLVVYKRKEEIGYEPMKKSKRGYYRSRFYKCNTRIIHVLHLILVAMGLLTGYITVIMNLFDVVYTFHCPLSMYYMIFSSLCMLAFSFWVTYDSKMTVLQKQIRLLVEFSGLYYYIAALVLVLVTNTDLVENP